MGDTLGISKRGFVKLMAKYGKIKYP